jgi:hypothetical protein
LGRLGRLARRVYQERSRRSNINLMLCFELSLLRIQKQPRRQHAISHILIPEFRCRPPLPICCARQGSVFQNDSTLWLCRGGQSGEDPRRDDASYLERCTTIRSLGCSCSISRLRCLSAHMARQGCHKCFDIPAASEVAEASLQGSQHAEKPTRRRAEARTDIYEENSPPLIDRSEA